MVGAEGNGFGELEGGRRLGSWSVPELSGEGGKNQVQSLHRSSRSLLHCPAHPELAMSGGDMG